MRAKSNVTVTPHAAPAQPRLEAAAEQGHDEVDDEVDEPRRGVERQRR